MTRGEANNNPFDLRWSPAIPWQGLANPPADSKGFCIFQTYTQDNPAFWGLRAGAKDLFVAFSRDGLKTIAGLVTRYAPPKENDTEAYINGVCKGTGWTRDQLLDLAVPDCLLALAKAFLVEEQGLCKYTDEQLRPAVASALAIGK